MVFSRCALLAFLMFCLFQGQEPGQVQRGGASQPPLQGRGHDDSQAQNRAASSVIRDPGAEDIPPAAAGIFLFSPNL